MPIHLVAFGAVTAVGGTAPVATAAIRARLSGLRMEGPDQDEDDPSDEGGPTSVGRAQAGAPETLADDLKRMTAQLKQAVAECLLPLPRGKGPLPELVTTYLVVRDKTGTTDPLTPVLKNALTPLARVHATHRIVAGHAGGGLAIDLALTALQSGEVQLALIAGVDARTSEAALAALAAEGRLLTMGRSFGFFPGKLPPACSWPPIRYARV